MGLDTPWWKLLGLYNKRIVSFALFVFLAGFVYLWVSGNRSSADENIVLSQDTTSSSAIQVKVTGDGRITVDGKASGATVKPLKDVDELRMPVIDQNGQSYSLLQIVLTLPSPVAYKTNHETLAIHGTGSAKSYVKDDSTIVYETEDVSAFATVSIVAQMPKGTVKPSIGLKLQRIVMGVTDNIWLISAIALPAFTIIFAAFFLLYQSRRQHVDVPDVPIEAPPMAIPPALVGVLIHQKVRAREVAATLVDLAVRGDIMIIDRERGFAFGKGRFDQRLLGYEKMLLSKIFRNNMSADRLELEKRINDHFYSKKISLVSTGIYGLSTRLGYFNINPQRIHTRFRFTGIGFFLLGLAGFVVSLIYFTDPPYVVFFWVGMMLSALIIAYRASDIPMRTTLGQEALSNWLAFKKFLSSPEPLPFAHNLDFLFQKYLPYAIVLDCEAAWAKRFAKHNFSVPSWFITDKPGIALEDFCLLLFPIISYVSRSLVALREPGFE